MQVAKSSPFVRYDTAEFDNRGIASNPAKGPEGVVTTEGGGV